MALENRVKELELQDQGGDGVRMGVGVGADIHDDGVGCEQRVGSDENVVSRTRLERPLGELAQSIVVNGPSGGKGACKGLQSSERCMESRRLAWSRMIYGSGKSRGERWWLLLQRWSLWL